MKKIIIVLLAVVSTTTAFAQENAISKYFSGYSSDTSYTKVSVTSKMFSLFTEIDSEDDTEKELLDALSKLKGIKVLKSRHIKNASGLFAKAVNKTSNDSRYEELMSVQDGNENVKFMIKESKGLINELFMIANIDDQFVLMSLYGEIDLKQISKLSKIVKMDGVNHLKVLSDDDDDEK